MQTIKLSDIRRDDRMRRDYKDIPELAESLWTKGFIHPIALTPEGQLIAGGRRSRALDYIIDNLQTVAGEWGDPDPSMLSFPDDGGTLQFGVHFTIKVADSFADLSELELIENVQRQSMSWQEECLGVAKIHHLKQQQAALGKLDGLKTWGQRETGKLFGLSVGNINYTLMLAKELADEKSPLWSADTATEAIRMMVQAKHDQVSKQLADNTKARANQLPTIAGYNPPAAEDLAFIQSFDPSAFSVAGGVAEIADEYGVTPSDSGTSEVSADGKSGSNIEQDAFDEAYAAVSRMVTLMKMEDWCAALPEGCVDHIITDPPYGIEMDNLVQADIDKVADTHDVEQNLSDIPGWLRGCWRILKDKGFCIWWCDTMNFRFIHDEAVKVGFRVQRWPYNWLKTSPCRNSRAEFNTTKNTEMAIIMRKPGGRLLSAQSSSTFIGQMSEEDKKLFAGHPFAKPRELWEQLFSMVALPGSTLADPFSGQGSMTCAAIRQGFVPMTCEMDENHHRQQLMNAANILKGMGR